MLVSILELVSEQPECRHISSESLYFFALDFGFRAAMVSRALLRHSCGSRLLAACVPIIRGI